MSATAGLVVQMTPEEKDALDRRARSAGLTTSEFVRRRIADDDLDEHRQEIDACLTAIETAGPSIMRKLDAAISTPPPWRPLSRRLMPDEDRAAG